VLVSQLADTLLVPRSIWIRGRSDDRATLEAITELRVRVHYPLIEADVAQHQQVAIVDAANSRSRTPKGLADILQWQSYVVASVALGGRTIGLLHAGVARAEPLDAFARTLVWIYAQGFAEAFERATLRELLARHRRELARAVQSISAWLTTQADAGALAEGSVQAALTNREREVMRLLIRGHTNLAIANALLISEGTVKYHVKNILRKLQATSRADAISRYLRAVQ
jgi:DNA-binding CsgD family transcriptional regulator